MKDLRLFSHVRNDESLKLLKATGTTVTVCHSVGSMSDYVFPFMQISDFAHSFVNRKQFLKWEMELSYFTGVPPHDMSHFQDPSTTAGQHRTHVRSMYEDRLLDDLVWLMGQPHAVSTLDLSGQMGTSPKSWQMYKVVLSGLKYTLSTLTLSLKLCNDPAFPSTAMEFDHLTTLRSVTIGLGRLFDSEPLLNHFIQAFLPAVGNINHLAFVKSDLAITVNGLDGLPFLKEITELQSTDLSKFADLSALLLQPSHDQVIGQLQMLKPLQKLELFEVKPLSVEIPTILCRALSTHADSLTDLTLHFSFTYPGEVKTINFPDRMQCLRSLRLLFQYRTELPDCVRVVFGDGDAAGAPVNYNLHFPSLSKLSIWPVKERGWNQPPAGPPAHYLELPWFFFYEALAPFFRTGTNPNGQRIPVTTVTALDIPFLLNGKYPRFWDHLELLFPNVEFPPSLQAARREEVLELHPDFD